MDHKNNNPKDYQKKFGPKHTFLIMSDKKENKNKKNLKRKASPQQ